MNTSVSNFIQTTKGVCLYTTISIILIIIFIISPLNQIIMASVFGKIGIIILLFYTIYLLFSGTFLFVKNYNVDFLDTSWNEIKTNVFCNYIFGLFLIFLSFCVIRRFF
jgi:hypothetical protein